MPFYDREDKILDILMREGTVTPEHLAAMLYVSLPTVRRDLIRLDKKGLILRSHGSVAIKRTAADAKIPFSLREDERSTQKDIMARRAAELVSDGDTVMLDGSTSAYHIIPYLAEKKDIIVITSGAKAALRLAELGIQTVSSGGRMINRSFSYVGEDATATILRYNADVAFFSCRGLSDDGTPSDNSAEENEVRRAMMRNSKKKILLCDKRKLGKVFLNNLCRPEEIDIVISE